MLADLGAEVLKVGNARRAATRCAGWRRTRTACRCGGRSPTATSRASRSICASRRARRCSAGWSPKHDVLVENFRTGTLDGWGITRDWLQGINPRLTILRVTGFGQTGPYRRNPGFARVFEAMSGFTRMCGEEGGTPLHLGYPISDPVGGLFGAIGILAELYRIKDDPDRPRPGDRLRGHRGHDAHARIPRHRIRPARRRAHRRAATAASMPRPATSTRPSDGKWASIAASTQSIYRAVLHGARSGSISFPIRASSITPRG